MVTQTEYHIALAQSGARRGTRGRVHLYATLDLEFLLQRIGHLTDGQTERLAAGHGLAVVLLGLRVEIRSALAAVVNQMLPQIQASNAFSDSVNERFATTAKEHEQLLERVVSLEGHERRLGRIEHHLDKLPFPLRLPPEERPDRG